jgi:hypothetical protein
MSQVNDLHNKAMELVDQAFLAKRRGNDKKANQLTREALQSETAATELLQQKLDAEPTRSVLYRSAASLALECGEVREAERLISKALSGNPPDEIAEELRDLLEQAHFVRHLKLNKVDLTSGELQFSIAGSAVGYGMALSESLIERIKDMERLVYRTVEKKLGRQFREHGATAKNIFEGYSLYVAAPRAGSFAITLRLGRQMELPGFDLSNEVIDDILDCFTLLEKGEGEKLKSKFPHEAYYQNFLGLAKRIAPDGKDIKMVGFTKKNGEKEVELAFTQTQDAISTMVAQSTTSHEEVKKLIKVTGRLLLADARKPAGKIQLIEPNNTAYTIEVPPGMMDDIVKPLWDEIVEVTGLKKKSKIILKEISKAS